MARVDPNSETWIAITEALKKHRSAAFQRLATEDCKERDADYQRGRISIADELMALSKAPKKIQPFETDPYS